MCHESLIDFPVVITVPLLWGDHDAFGHVNNLVYLRWCETARVEYFMRIGLWPALPPAGVGPILASISCDYKRPLTFPDTAYIGARVTRIGNRSFQMQHRVVSRALAAVAASKTAPSLLHLALFFVGAFAMRGADKKQCEM